MSAKIENVNETIEQQNGQNEETQFQTKEIMGQQVIKRSLWTPDERIAYVLFLEDNQSDFENQQLRRAKKVFLRLSSWVDSRTVLQCKSHHQKMMAKFRSIPKIIKRYLSKAQRLKKNGMVGKSVEQEIICKDQSDTEIMKPRQQDFYNESEENNSLWSGIDWGYFNKQASN